MGQLCTRQIEYTYLSLILETVYVEGTLCQYRYADCHRIRTNISTPW